MIHLSFIYATLTYTIIHFLIHHWSLVIVVGFILFSVVGVILEMVFDGGPLDHDEDTWGSD